MTIDEIKQRIASGEDSFTQFKSKLNSKDALAEELCAFVNAQGGLLFVGVNDDKTIQGITTEQEQLYEQWIISAINEGISPSIFALTRNYTFDDKRIIVIEVDQGLHRPYRTKKGKYPSKSEAGKRMMSADEISGLALTPQKTFEELPIISSTIDDIEKVAFSIYFDKRYGDLDNFLSENTISFAQLLANLRLAEGNNMTLPGLLCFYKYPQQAMPVAYIQAVTFKECDSTDPNYISKEDLDGTLKQQYQKAKSYFQQTMQKLSEGTGFNNAGKLEIPFAVFEELMINALVHRDYSVSAPIKLFIFSNRIEIISPGGLYNSLTIANIKMGVSRWRNPLLSQVASHLLPSGMGTGIGRSLKAYDKIEFVNNREAHEFRAIVYRPAWI